MSRPPFLISHIKKSAKIFLAGGMTDLRVFGPDGPIKVGRFTAQKALEAAVESQPKATAFYATFNRLDQSQFREQINQLVAPTSGGSASDADITHRLWMLIDLDPVRESGVGSTNEEHDAAIGLARHIRDYLDGLGFHKPILADSGNGAHLLYKIDLPADDGDLVKRCLAALAHRFGNELVKVDQSVHNPSRIVRLYGTMNRKGESTKSRPHRVSKVLDWPDDLLVTPEDLLRKLASDVEMEPVRAQRVHPTSPSGDAFDVERFIQDHNLPVVSSAPYEGGHKWVLCPCPWNPEHNNKPGPGFIIQHASGAVSAGCQHDSCQDRIWADLRGMYDIGYQQRRDRDAGGVVVSASSNDHGQARLLEEPGEATPAPIEGELGRIEFKYASELTAGSVTPWVWMGWVAKGYVTLLVGLWKAGKTTLLARWLNLSGAGGDLAGEVLPAKILVISEEGEGLWADRRDELGLGDHVAFVFRPFKGRPTRKIWEQYLEQVAITVKAERFDVVVIDTWQSVSPSPNENDAAEMMAALSPVHHITEAGAAVLLIHHPRKGDAGEGQASRGSGALPGFVDTVMELRRYDAERPDDRRRKLKGLSRFDETPSEVVIELGQDGYRTVGGKADAAREDREGVYHEILSGLNRALTVIEIRNAWPADGPPKPGLSSAKGDLASGWKKGLWGREGGGCKGSPYKYLCN